MRRLALSLLLTFFFAAPALAVPFWGAKESSPADTPPGALKPGEFVWAPDVAPEGPIVVVVSLTEQRALRLSQRRPDRVHDRQHRQAGTRDADRHLHDPAEGQGSPLVQVQQRADAVPGAPDLGRRCAARGRSAGLPGVARLRSPAVEVRRGPFRRVAHGDDRRHRRRQDGTGGCRAPCGPCARGCVDGRGGHRSPAAGRGEVALAAREIARRARYRS